MSWERRLTDISPGETGRVLRLCCQGGIRRRLFDIGLIQGTTVECVGRSPAGDPSAYLIREAVIALRSEDANQIIME